MSGLRIERVESTALWVVDRPAARNAIDAEVVRALAAALDQAERDPGVRAVVLTGEGDTAFIAGADLKFLQAATLEQRAEQDLRMLELLTRIEALPVPVIAALNGVVMGGGAEVALACDLRVAEPNATFTFKHVAMGVTPGWGGLRRLTSIVGRGTASKLLLTAQPCAAAEALRVGLVDELVEPGTARTRALELARAVAQVSAGAVADTKRLLSRAAYTADEAAQQEERRTFERRTQHADHAEAVAAFLERRPARFAPRS